MSTGWTPPTRPGRGRRRRAGSRAASCSRPLRALDGVRVVGADVVEVAPAYDHAELTTIAAANVVYELLALFVRRRARSEPDV